MKQKPTVRNPCAGRYGKHTYKNERVMEEHRARILHRRILTGQPDPIDLSMCTEKQMQKLAIT